MAGFVYYTILRGMIETYKTKGFEIMTSKHVDYPDDMGSILHGYRPDVVAFKNGLYTICDVETSETLDLKETLVHLKAISNSDYALHLGVPSSCYTRAKSIVNSHHIAVSRWWTADDL